MNTKTSELPFLIEVLSTKQKRLLKIFIGLWLIAVWWFWVWWLQPQHILGYGRYFINTILLSWTLLLPGYFFFFVLRMKKTNPALSIPDNWRIAMVVTKAPSEPWSVVKKTLTAMLNQLTTHDTWLADEDPQPETIDWCNQHGVKISTRKGVIDYHRATWPRRTKCKEGNLAYFYDHYGYANYDFVVQLDADHVSTPGYLEAMIRPFNDSKVGYVSAPSICDANAGSSWVARSRLYIESGLHGPLQTGYNNGLAPLCIGSHYAIRTEALKQIGGLGPELAEDFSTSLMMNAGGWKGVHAVDAIAHGDGPASFTDFIIQEFQWSRSMVMILLTMFRSHWLKLPFKLKIQFIFLMLWYPLYGLMMLMAFFLPLIALITNTPWVNVDYMTFALYTGILSFVGLLIFMNRARTPSGLCHGDELPGGRDVE